MLLSVLYSIIFQFLVLSVICSKTPFKGLAPINEVKEVLFHIIFNIFHHYQECVNMANSSDPDETPHFAGVCKCSLFGIICINTYQTKQYYAEYLIHCADYSAHGGHFDQQINHLYLHCICICFM